MENQVLQYALKENVLVSINDVKSGLDCRCVCPHCKKLLIAKKGKKRIWHFAHCSPYTDCKHGYETALHLLAKQILLETKKFVLPKVLLDNKEVIVESKEIVVEKVQEEKFLNNIKPDIILSSGGEQYCIEIYVTHKIDDKKLFKIRQANIEVIEIDLSRIGTVNENKLREILLTDNVHKKWVYTKQIDLYKPQNCNIKDYSNERDRKDYSNERDQKDYSNERDRKKRISGKLSDNNICPKCGMEMELCYNLYGAFYKCLKCGEHSSARLHDRYCPKCGDLLVPKGFKKGFFKPSLLKCKTCDYTEKF